MSLYDYEISKQLSRMDPPFYALVMALARKADTHNFALIERAWPSVVEELRRRYNAPGGLLEGES